MSVWLWVKLRYHTATGECGLWRVTRLPCSPCMAGTGEESGGRILLALVKVQVCDRVDCKDHKDGCDTAVRWFGMISHGVGIDQ